MALCAVCDSTNQTTRLCQRCRTDPKLKRYNVDWISSRCDELPDDDHIAMVHATGSADSDPGAFENKLALQIMHLYCLGLPYGGIAETLEVSSVWVGRVVAYWNDNHGYVVSVLKQQLESRDVGELPFVTLTTK